ncbi:MAG: hypothetical protein WCJ35_25735 [Planctomycetota bacterium]
MKFMFSHVLGVAAQILAALAACVGCTKSDPAPAEPRVLHWRGQDTGYDGTTVVPPADHPAAAAKD